MLYSPPAPRPNITGDAAALSAYLTNAAKGSYSLGAGTYASGTMQIKSDGTISTTYTC